MALTPTGKPTREWPLLVLAVALVGFVCVPLWQWSSGGDLSNTQWGNWTPERLSRLLLGPEQIACYFCFTWAGFILLSRYTEVLRQRRAFRLGVLPTEEGVRILPEDARPLQRKLEQLTRGRPYILGNMIRLALGKYAASRSGAEVNDTVRTQAEVDQGRLVTSMATVHYLAWAIPALGFLGTVRGLAGSLSMAGQTDAETAKFIEDATRHLNVAFDCTLIALLLSLFLMFLIHTVQRDEEALVIDCQQYCLEHLVNRLYEPKPEEDVAGSEEDAPAPAARSVLRMPRS
ncbi:MAG: MotA/TolQ/ExbB proton channel family protein [Gemmataceae bacterium]|nr:MotA/TolQ/ExbB proton channel family protein [Gemmataceae bacterium]